MTISSKLITLGSYLAGEFENQQQASEQPAWYVHLRLWKRPVPLFSEDSITLYAEQANILYLDSPYRPRLLRLREKQGNIQVDYYMFRDITAVKGAGCRPELLQRITVDDIEFLPNCTLNVQSEQLENGSYVFKAIGNPDSPCRVTYKENNYSVSLGFEVTKKELKVYDKGIDPETGKAIWGALMGAYSFQKQKDFSEEI